MPRTIERPAASSTTARQVTPSRVDSATAQPFTLQQELQPFGSWVGEPLWAPPLDSSKTLAKSMLRESRPFTSQEKRWEAVVEKHRNEFTQVREIDLPQASIRLPQGKFFVSVTEQQNFDQITETIPACVQTRLDEFMDGPGKKWGVKVYYLKPLCVEVGDDLILTTRDDLMTTFTKLQEEVFAEYRRMAFFGRSQEALLAAANLGLALPRRVVKYFIDRRQKAIDAYQARMEFKRRKTALGAARAYRKCRTDGCSFEEMLALTNPLQRADVVEHYSMEKKLSRAKRDQLLRMAAGSSPWLVTLSLGLSHLYTLSLTVTPPVMLCDPAFVAEMPDAPGLLLKIGHFDVVGGVVHIEI